MALWCRRSRCTSSSAVRMKRPATSEGAGEHAVQVSQWCGCDGQIRGYAEGSKPSAEVAKRKQEHHAIVRSVGKLGGMRKLTLQVFHFFANMRLPVLRTFAAVHRGEDHDEGGEKQHARRAFPPANEHGRPTVYTAHTLSGGASAAADVAAATERKK